MNRFKNNDKSNNCNKVLVGKKITTKMNSVKYPSSISLSSFVSSLLFFFVLSLLLPSPTSGPTSVSAYENRFKWIDRVIRAEPASAPSRDAVFINAPWKPNAEYLIDSVPFRLKDTLEAFEDETETISLQCMFALREFREQLRLGGKEKEKAEMRDWALKSKCATKVQRCRKGSFCLYVAHHKF